MRVVLHIPDGLGEQPFVGTTLAGWLARLVEEAGHAMSPVDEGDLALHIDGRYAAVRAESLGRLRLPGDALTTPDGVVIAGIGHRWDEIRGGDAAVSHDEAVDVRTTAGRARAERVVRRRLVEGLERAGVQIVDPERTLVDATVRVEPGAVLWPEVVLRGHTHVGAGAEIRPGCWLEDTEVGADALVKPHCVCEGAHIGAGSQVGPMAHLRPGARLEGDNKVGNFVEVKKARLARGAKASHLTYLGDADIGEGANIGAGTITCNYDGHRKHRTEIGAGAFIGSNSALVAPVRVGAGAIVGAGSTLTKDVDDDALAVERGTLKVLAGKGKALNERNARLKAREREERGGG